MSERFPAARAKLRRGRHHIAELESELKAFLARKPTLAVGYERQERGQYRFNMTLITMEVVPPGLVMIFGDAVHNLRAALDLLINEIVAERRTPPDDLAFPFARSKDRLGKQIREKMKDTTDVERDLVRELQPYIGGNELLAALHELDLKDKHRSPINVAVTATSKPMIAQGIPSNPHLVHTGKISEVPPEVASRLEPPEGYTRLGLLEDVLLESTIAKGLPMEGKEVTPTLQRLASAVEDVIDRFAALGRTQGAL